MADVIAERYRLVATLGEGGMGRVWRARDELLNRDIALKELVLPRGLSAADVAELRERAIREARAAARIDHPNVVRVFDVIQAQGEPWIVMELVASRSLFDVIREDGPLPPERAAEIGLAVLAGLRAAHRAGVLHRDVKPANVLLGDDGRVVLTDFGLAHAVGDSAMTSTGIVLGSPSYLAPERALDQGMTPAADLWSLGATLYAAVEGRPPYDKSSPMATLAALATQPPRPPEQAGVLRPALDGLLRKDPAERIDADEAERLLRDAAAGRAPVPQRRTRAYWWAAAAAVILLIAGLAARPMLGSARAQEVPGPQRPSPAPAGKTAAPAGKTGTHKAKGSPIANFATGDCLQLDAHSGRIVLSTCNGSDVQKFDFPADGTMRVLGRCVQVLGTDDGARLGVAGCDGRRAQRWNYNTSYDLVNLKLTRCTDVPDSRTADGTPAQVWQCAGTSNQKWRH